MKHTIRPRIDNGVMQHALRVSSRESMPRNGTMAWGQMRPHDDQVREGISAWHLEERLRAGERRALVRHVVGWLLFATFCAALGYLFAILPGVMS